MCSSRQDGGGHESVGQAEHDEHWAKEEVLQGDDKISPEDLARWQHSQGRVEYVQS